MPNQPIDDCFLHDKDRLTHAEALAILKANISPKSGSIELSTSEALGHCLSQTITAPRPIPAHRNAAVDGYAYRDSDYDRAKGSWLRLTHRIRAGDQEAKDIPAEASARIFTGAVMPEGLDSVAMQEDTKQEERPNPDASDISTPDKSALDRSSPEHSTYVFIPPGMKPAANCRRAGEDTKEGTPLVEAGTRLSPQHIAALASGGINKVEVHARLNIACLSTGNEIIRRSEDFQLGRVFDSNGPMIASLAQAQHCKVTDLGIIRDSREEITKALGAAAEANDVIITSGGASKGEEDHIITSLGELGTRHMWQLAIKPGRPMTFGQIGKAIFIGLPGNPVAAFVCFLLYVSPLLRRLGGEAWPEPPRYQLPAAFAIASKKPDRREFLRGRLINEDGTVHVQKYEQDGSGLIQSLTSSDGLIELEEATTEVQKGSLVNFLPFSYWNI